MDKIDFDLAKHFDAAVERIDTREVDETLTPELRESILTQPRAALYARVQDALSEFRLDRIPAALADYRVALRERMTWERAEGSLKPPSLPADEIKRWSATGLFERFCWNGFHTRTLSECLEQDDLPIKKVDFDAIETSKRTIPRWSDFWDQLRPTGVSKEFWAKKGVPPSVVQEKKDRERLEQERAARPLWNDSADAGAGPNVAPR